MTKIKRIPCGDVNCFLVSGEKNSILIDTGSEGFHISFLRKLLISDKVKDAVLWGNKMINYIIREIKPTELHLLQEFLYEAIYQRDETNLLPKDVINQPELKIYIDEYGKDDDFCLVAEVKGQVVGAVWTRILSGKIKGFGYIDSHTPEFAISLFKDYRNKGIGTALMKEMLRLLKSKGYKRASLAVQKDNYAVKMYKKLGFETFKELEEEYIMVCDLCQF